MILDQKTWIGLAALLILGTSGCATFQLTDEPFYPKGKTLAIIAGLTNPSSVHAAQALAEEVGKTSQFQVLPPIHVARAIPNYPQLIKGPYQSAYFEIDEDYQQTDVARVKELQHHLGADYLYILWAPTSVQHGGKGLFFKNYPVLHVVAQVFEFPGGKEIGRAKYLVRVDDDRGDILRDDLARVAKEFAEKTRMAK